MKRSESVYFAWCAAIVVASLVYVAPAFTSIPLVWYYPVAHTWALESRPSGFALDWYGRTLWAVLAGVMAFGLGRAISARLATPSMRAYRIWAAWVGMTSLLAIAVYAYQLANRHPAPEPLPAGYQAR